MTTLPDGVFLVDKPVGMTSFDVIRRLRKERGVRKMGHAGTLDPLASGLLIIAEGGATKLLCTYLKLPKVYLAEVCIGERTNTGDREGSVLEEKPVTSPFERAMLDETVVDMAGMLELPTPAYSAIKRGGEPLYKKARHGEVVEVPTRAMQVDQGTLLDVQYQNDREYLTIEWHVGSGTYVRSLAEELGRRLGYPARLENLRRTRIGEFDITDARII